ncbi:MICOS complex subunit MIC19 [Ischnura elegans]|uniref:MICOS complex subunit MIC19 n=1 Tax=Ischnura elegans TaxID=197161 RepID=UPI001ED89CA4|nr:MICOS complex subunit MIC19 [Ischnura elegans]
MVDSPRSRSITIVNEDPSRLILVTESVVKRLKGASQAKPQTSRDTLHSVSSGPDISSKKNDTLTAREEELLEIEGYWMDRLQSMDDNHTRMNHLAEKDMERSLADYERKFGNAAAAHPKCFLNIKDIIECYKENPKQTLKCNKEMEAFSECLDNLYVEDCH